MDGCRREAVQAPVSSLEETVILEKEQRHEEERGEFLSPSSE
jgi:hypothetical protein